jgi:NADH-quinone oxidoreductase subunit M
MATGMLFAMAGWVYDQTHSRDIPSLGGLSNRMPFIAGCFVVACMASIGVPGTVNFIAEVMIIVGSWNKYPFQVIVAVVGIVLTLAYLFKMMRGLFYGPMDQKYSHAHDAVSVADRLPLLIMIAVSIGFFFFPMHLYNVVRSGVDPLIAKITRVVPVALQERETSGANRETRAASSPENVAALPVDMSPLTPYASRSDQ